MPPPVTPLLTTDIVIELIDRPERPIVLIERMHEPLGWAIPGGFVEVGETVEEAAVREAIEETSLHVTLKALLGVYSDPRRDPRGHTASVVYVAEARTDARAVALFTLEALPRALAFDHARILRDYLVFRRIAKRPAPAVV